MRCPFCGSDKVGLIAKVYISRDEPREQLNRWYVGCDKCGGKGGERDGKVEALEAWDMRNNT